MMDEHFALVITCITVSMTMSTSYIIKDIIHFNELLSYSSSPTAEVITWQCSPMLFVPRLGQRGPKSNIQAFWHQSCQLKPIEAKLFDTGQLAREVGRGREGRRPAYIMGEAGCRVR